MLFIYNNRDSFLSLKRRKEKQQLILVSPLRYGPLGQQRFRSMRTHGSKPDRWEGLISNAEGEIHYPSIEFFGEQEAAVQNQQEQEPWPATPSPVSIEGDESRAFEQSSMMNATTPKADQGCMPSCCTKKDGYSQLEESWQVRDSTDIPASPLETGSFSPELLQR